jgi:hypothetical protein
MGMTTPANSPAAGAVSHSKAADPLSEDREGVAFKLRYWNERGRHSRTVFLDLFMAEWFALPEQNTK